jgi:hypothetical protein
LDEIILQLALVIQVKDVECVNTNLGVQVFFLDMLPTPLSQKLEWQNLLVNWIIGDQLSVDDEVLNCIGNVLSEKFCNIRVGNCHIFQVSAVDPHNRLFFAPKVNLTSKPVIFVLAGKVDSVETLQDDLNTFCWLSKHRFQWYSHSHVTI